MSATIGSGHGNDLSDADQIRSGQPRPDHQPHTEKIQYRTHLIRGCLAGSQPMMD
jgi:hypothetical protein